MYILLIVNICVKTFTLQQYILNTECIIILEFEI